MHFDVGKKYHAHVGFGSLENKLLSKRKCDREVGKVFCWASPISTPGTTPPLWEPEEDIKGASFVGEEVCLLCLNTLLVLFKHIFDHDISNIFNLLISHFFYFET